MNMPHFSRIARAAVIAEKQKEYVEAARAIGASDWRIVVKSILPNTIPPLLAQIATAIPRAILLEASLSFWASARSPRARLGATCWRIAGSFSRARHGTVSSRAWRSSFWCSA